jgi:hypothetical protein
MNALSPSDEMVIRAMQDMAQQLDLSGRRLLTGIERLPPGAQRIDDEIAGIEKTVGQRYAFARPTITARLLPVPTGPAKYPRPHLPSVCEGGMTILNAKG